MNHNLYLRIRSAIFKTPWAILPGRLDVILAYLEARASGNVAQDLIADEIKKAEIEAAAAQDAAMEQGVAVIPVSGTITHRSGGMSAMSGRTTTPRQIVEQTRKALDDSRVGAIIHHYHSPGGTVDGVPEAAESIRKMRGEKPIVAMADTMAASAAYWLASAADEIVVTPSGEVGSIGVFAVHEDFSAQYERLGETYNLIASTPKKGEGMDFLPLTDDYRSYLEDQVLAFDDMFVTAVAKGRGVKETEVRQSYGQGRMVMAKQAVSAGMADRVATYDQTLARLMAGCGKKRRRRALAEGSGTAEVATVQVSIDDTQIAATREKLEEMEEISARIADNVRGVSEGGGVAPFEADDTEPTALEEALGAQAELRSSIESGNCDLIEIAIADAEQKADALSDAEKQAHKIQNTIDEAYGILAQIGLESTVGAERAAIAAANIANRRRWLHLRGQGPGRTANVR